MYPTEHLPDHDRIHPVGLPIGTPIQRRRSRAKRHRAWEQIELQSGGLYATYLQELSKRYPSLSSMELRVAALVRGMFPSWEIAQKLGISEKTVENHRTSIRRKLGLEKGTLLTHLIGNSN